MRWVFVMMLGLVAAGAGAWFSLDARSQALGTDEAAPTDDVANHENASADEGDPSVEDSMMGVVVPQREVYLAPSHASRVASVDVVVGQAVEAEERLAVMDTREKRDELAAARAAAAAARAQARRMQVEAQHSREALSKAESLQGVVAEAEIDELRAETAAASAGRQGAGASASERSARARQIATRIEDAEIRAPFAGIVSKRLAEPGARLGAGEPIIHVISKTLIVRFAVPEGRADEMYVGKALHVRLQGSDEELRAVITSIAPEVETTARIVIAEAELEPLGARRLRAGSLARVSTGPAAVDPARPG